MFSNHLTEFSLKKALIFPQKTPKIECFQKIEQKNHLKRILDKIVHF